MKLGRRREKLLHLLRLWSLHLYGLAYPLLFDEGKDPLTLRIPVLPEVELAGEVSDDPFCQLKLLCLR